MTTDSTPQVFEGIAASPGVVVGRVYLIDRRRVRIPRYHIETDQVDYETNRLTEAVHKSVEQLEAVRERFVHGGHDHQAILEAHEMMLRDQALLDEAHQIIRKELRNAEWVVEEVISRLRSLFEQVSEPYLRERRSDIDFVGERILRNLAGQPTDLSAIEPSQSGTIVVAHDLSPADTAQLVRHRITGFVTELGSRTSHTSIIARSLGVPAVVGARGIFECAGSGDVVLIDGFSGRATLRPNPNERKTALAKGSAFERVHMDLLEARALPATTLDGHAIKVAGNIEMPHEVTDVFDRGGTGIGLYRTEFMYVSRTTLPNEEEHYRNYCQIFEEIGDAEVTIRTLDLGADKVPGNEEGLDEPNPALGLRAIRYSMRRPELFEAQVAGLLRAGVRGNARLMLPMISGIAELRRAKEMIETVKTRLTREKKLFVHNLPVGIMIEVPSAVLVADLLAAEVDFMSIGSNDLMQYLLAIDRTNNHVAYLYDPLHPAMLRSIETVMQAARRADIEVSMCGEMAGELRSLPILLASGIHQLSMNSSSLPPIKRLVRELRLDDCKELLRHCMACTTQTEVNALTDEFFAQKTDDWVSVWQPG